ncbi:hypothetical protein C8R46DRAFT_1096944 [Mycena filopes]|nr:hypothetical protein C8R46DRAFT_1096944 [Mycena filopes]
MAGPLDATYGAWFISLWLETMLYGVGLLQTWLYFHWYPADGWSIKSVVLLVTALETVQVVFFFASSYSRFVDRFGLIQTDLIWQDSLQLLANYLSAFAVQLYFANRIRQLIASNVRSSVAAKLGLALIFLLALTQLGSGIAQTILTAQLHSFLKLEQTKAISTLQCAASLLCDIVITVYLCIVLQNYKGGMASTNSILNTLIINAINRGMLTALASAFTMVLFLATPGTLYFFLSLAMSSKFYMNSMLATLNTRQHVRAKSAGSGWNSVGPDVDAIPLPATHARSSAAGHNSTAAVVSNVRFDHAYPSSELDQKDF